MRPFSRFAAAAALLAAVTAVTPRPAAAQIVTASQTLQRRPALEVFVGAGVAGERGVTVVSGGIRRSIGRHLMIEGEAAGWRTDGSGSSTEYYQLASGLYAPITTRANWTMSGWSAGANVLLRTRQRRVTLFGGGGMLIDQYRLSGTQVVAGCPPPPLERPYCRNGTFEDSQPFLQSALKAVGGVDARVAERVTAYGLIEVGTAMYRQIGLLAGIRVSVKSRD